MGREMADGGGALEAVVARLERVAAALEGKLDAQQSRSGGGVVEQARGDASAAPSSSASVSAFDELVAAKVGRVGAAGERIGGDLGRATETLRGTFAAERAIVAAIARCRRPAPDAMPALVGPLARACAAAHEAADARKRSEAFNAQKVVAESLAALSWVVYSGRECGLSLPAAHVEESWQSAEFYNNKILVEQRGKSADHVEWARAVKDLFVPSLRDYVKQFHATGPSWNVNGVDVSQLGDDASPAVGPARSAPAAPTRGPPPPPPKGPPPPPGPPPPAVGSSDPAAPGMSAVLKELNKGEAVAAGLKKVTDDMKTKNRADRTGAVPAATAVKGGGGGVPTGTATATARGKKEPVLELQLGRKWAVEHQVGNRDLVIEDTNSRQSVYVFACRDSVLRVEGKVNNITLDGCARTALVFNEVVAALEVVNCTSVEVQCQGAAPTIAVDNTSGCHVYLSSSEAALASSITTAKSSELTVAVPGAGPDDDPVEHALPEQFLNVFRDGQFVTTPVSHSGG